MCVCVFSFYPRCHIRVIDTFGTEPAYNHEEYATLHGYRTNWGYWNLHGQQYMTMFRMLILLPCLFVCEQIVGAHEILRAVTERKVSVLFCFFGNQP